MKLEVRKGAPKCGHVRNCANVLGQHVEAAERYVTENPSAHLHLYGKLEAKHNRKMGHVTLFSDVHENDNIRGATSAI